MGFIAAVVAAPDRPGSNPYLWFIPALALATGVALGLNLAGREESSVWLTIYAKAGGRDRVEVPLPVGWSPNRRLGRGGA